MENPMITDESAASEKQGLQDDRRALHGAGMSKRPADCSGRGANKE